MPLTAKGEEIKSALTKEYGAEKGERVLYAGKNKGTFTGIDASQYESKEEEDKVRAERRKKALEEAEKPRDIKPGVAKSSGSKRPFMVDSATMTRIADAVDGLARRFDAMVDAYGK